MKKSPPGTPKTFEKQMKSENTTMTPASRGHLARENFLAGYGCAQAVLLAFSDMTGLDGKTAAAMASSFGGGMGRMREVCGAVSAALMVLGIAEGYTAPHDAEGKSAHYARVRDFAERFKNRCAMSDGSASIVCRDLLTGANVPATVGGEAETRNAEYYRKRPCPDLCAMAAEVLQEMLNERP